FINTSCTTFRVVVPRIQNAIHAIGLVISGINKTPGGVDGLWIFIEIVKALIFIVTACAIQEKFALYMNWPHRKFSRSPPRNVAIGISIHYIEAGGGEF